MAPELWGSPQGSLQANPMLLQWPQGLGEASRTPINSLKPTRLARG